MSAPTERMTVTADQASAARQVTRERSSRTRRLISLGPPTAVIVALLVAWELAVKLFDIKQYLLPAPTQIASYMVDHPGILWSATLVTTKEILLAFGISIVLGVPLGMLLAQDSAVSRSVYPVVVGSQTFPKLALGPLFIVWFGFGITPKLILAFLVAFFPLTIATTVGIHSVRAETRLLARSIGLNPAQRFIKVTLPQALPSVFGGLKVAITLAVVGVVVAEFLGATSGIGYLIINATGTVDTLLLFSALVALTVVGLVLYMGVALAERLAIPWWFNAQHDDR
jgi:NitT/TauT family transport system permease protein